LSLGFSTVPLFIGDENMSRKPKESLGKDPEKDKIEYNRWENPEENPSIGRPPTVEFFTVGDSGRSIGRSLFSTKK